MTIIKNILYRLYNMLPNWIAPTSYHLTLRPPTITIFRENNECVEVRGTVWVDAHHFSRMIRHQHKYYVLYLYAPESLGSIWLSEKIGVRTLGRWGNRLSKFPPGLYRLKPISYHDFVEFVFRHDKFGKYEIFAIDRDQNNKWFLTPNKKYE